MNVACFAALMVRLMLVLTPAACVLGGMVVSELLARYAVIDVK